MKKTIITLPAFLLLVSCGGGSYYDAAGTFEADVITVSAQQTGLITDIPVHEGDTVAKGDTLALIDTTELHLQKLLLEKQLKTVRSSRPDSEKQVASLRSQIAQQQREKARTESLLKAGAATRKSLDDIESRISVLQSQLDATMSSLRISTSTVDGNSSAIEIQIAQVEDRLSRCRVTAPCAGTVLAKFCHSGEIAVGAKPMFKLADMSTVYLRCYFASEQLADIEIGRQVTVIADFGGDTRPEYKGTVCWISEESEFTPKSIQTRNSRSSLVYAVKIAVPNDGRIKLGLAGEAIL